MQPSQKTILVAPLNWGLGHATRCIPLITELLCKGFKVLVASDGASLALLKLEFPELPCIELPSYNIKYPKNARWLKWRMLFNLSHIRKTIRSETKLVAQLVAKGQIDGIISDNRFGIRNDEIPSAFITHQLNVVSGSTSMLSSLMHQKIIKKFDACWVPDVEDRIYNISGKLGHLKNSRFPVEYIGPLSRMKPQNIPKKYDVLALISGPEPQRTQLEELLKVVFFKTELKVVMVCGNVEKEERWKQLENITIVNFLKSDNLEQVFNQSEIVVCRSGYSTIMDLVALEKNAFFIPTPGQYEQEYLAKRLKHLGIVPCCKQNEFTVEKLNQTPLYKGLKAIHFQQDYNALFSFFQSK